MSIPTLGTLRASIATELDSSPSQSGIDRSNIQIIGSAVFAAGFALGLGNIFVFGDNPAKESYLIMFWGSVFIQGCGLYLWAWAKNQPLWFCLLVAPFGLIGAIVLMLTPTLESRR